MVFSAAKLFFAYGLGNAMSFPMSVGATAVLLPQRPTPDAVFDDDAPPPPDASSTACRRSTRRCWRTRISAAGAGSDRLRLCVSAGEALPAHIGERWRAIAGVDVLDGIGSTEMLQTFLSNRPGDVRYGSTGKPVPGYELKIVDEQRPRGRRRRGRRTARARAVRRRGLLEPARQEPPHLRGRMDPHRRQISCATPTATTTTAAAPTTCSRSAACGCRRSRSRPRSSSHEAVLEAAVIGKEDADGLIKPKAFIVLKNGYAADERPAGDAQGAREGTRRPVEISALDRRPRRPAAHRDRQDPALQAARGGRAAR